VLLNKCLVVVENNYLYLFYMPANKRTMMFTKHTSLYNNMSDYIQPSPVVFGLSGKRRPKARLAAKKPCDSCIAPPSSTSIDALLAKERRVRAEAAEAAQVVERQRQAKAAAEAAQMVERQRQAKAAAEAAQVVERQRQAKAAAEAAQVVERQRQAKAAAEAAPAEPPKEEELGVVFEKSPVTVLTDNFETGVMQKAKDVLLLLYAPWCGWCKRIAADYIKATEMLASNSNVELMVVDATQWQTTHPKVEIQGFPTVFLFKNADKANPVEYNGDRSAGDLVKFVKMHVGGKAEVETPNVQLKIAELDSSKLIEMTDNFDSVVMNNDKDVFVMFYAPWCGWCKKMMPDIEALAEKYSGNNKISIVRVDATAHKPVHEKVKIYGFPLVHLFKGNDKANPVEYKGDRSKDDMAMFIEENAVNK
jgi:protein disulfide-isomerase-like protein